MIQDHTEMTGAYSQIENFCWKKFHLQGALHVICRGSLQPSIVNFELFRDFRFSFFDFLFDPHVQGNKNWAYGAEASSTLPTLLQLYKKSRGMSVPLERTRKWTSDVAGYGDEVRSQSSWDPYQHILFLLHSANAQRSVPTDLFIPGLSGVKREGLGTSLVV